MKSFASGLSAVRWTASVAFAYGYLSLVALQSFSQPIFANGATAAAVDESRSKRAAEAAQWSMSGHDWQGTYYSPLTGINDANVSSLGFAWEFKTGTYRGLEATPIVVDGVMYTSGNWGVVYALDAATGRPLWTFDPKADGQTGRYACCDVVNRGVVVWKGRVYVGALDGRLFALDARTGRLLWVADTIVEHRESYTVTGAPQVAGDVIVIGNSGADMGKGGVRGYVSAYDLESGKFRWRFYTVPSRKDPVADASMKVALESWDQGSTPAGGTVWAGMAYDPELRLLYVGTGNAAPYEHRGRNPSGAGGDDLYASSIVALDAASGKLVWYYQTTPGDDWDQDADAPFVLAELPLGGRTRQVLMQASKNGFFYVLDRKTGELLSGKPFTYITWASGLDARGRPILTAASNYSRTPQLIYPGPAGSHSWTPMSFSPRTQLVYIPVIDAPNVWLDLQGRPVSFIEGSFAVGAIPTDSTYDPNDLRSSFGHLPEYGKGTGKKGRGDAVRNVTRGVLRAWDPVTQATVWEVETSRDYLVYDGGVLSTAGNLVVQGRMDGSLYVYTADSGRVLKVLQTGTATMAAPMTYVVNGVQYIVVMQGYGGGNIGSAFPPFAAASHYVNQGRVLALRVGGGAIPVPPPREVPVIPEPPARGGTAEQRIRGAALYVSQCSRCHVFGVGVLPDLRTFPLGAQDAFDDIVLRGRLASLGMGRFDDVLTAADTAAIRAYLISEARSAFKAQQSAHH